MTLTFDEVLVLKKKISDEFGLYLHFHDRCGSQSFSFDEDISQEVRLFIEEYFKQQGGTVKFDGREFAVE